mmetsp:Transcript_39186/g.103687  ORF Transcript_39186/g.103687 Transcript_39186/m.103687 type:complete len:122 (+) Transcript_39186:732-1097(+)
MFSIRTGTTAGFTSMLCDDNRLTGKEERKRLRYENLSHTMRMRKLCQIEHVLDDHQCLLLGHWYEIRQCSSIQIQGSFTIILVHILTEQFWGGRTSRSFLTLSIMFIIYAFHPWRSNCNSK